MPLPGKTDTVPIGEFAPAVDPVEMTTSDTNKVATQTGPHQARDRARRRATKLAFAGSRTFQLLLSGALIR